MRLLVTRRIPFAILCLVVGSIALSRPLWAVSIELNDVAPDRIERQRLVAAGKQLPGTPDMTRLGERLAAAGMPLGSAMLLRFFKSSSELELWMLKDGAFQLFATYPICYFSGTIGPKVREGDRQAPEGFYTISFRELHHGRRWRRSLNIGFPNPFDKAQGRSGSDILVHGGCSSIGCFAMTNDVIHELYTLAESALRSGQPAIPVHVFPFRMTEAAVAAVADRPWAAFWNNLKTGYDYFERTHLAPRISVCRDRYEFAASAPETADLTGPLELCGTAIEAAEALDWHLRAATLVPTAWQNGGLHRLKDARAELAGFRARRSAALTNAWAAAARANRQAASIKGSGNVEATAAIDVSCTLARPSCRKFVALRERVSAAKARVVRNVKQHVVARKAKQKVRTASRGK